MYLVSRLRVAGNRYAVRVLNFPKPFTFIGPDASLALCRTLARSGAKRVMVITDSLLFQLGLAGPVIAALEGAGVSVEVFSDVEPDPDYAVVLNGVDRLRRSGAGAVLAIGGGSSIDCAKAMVICHANDRHPSQLTGLWLYALPRKRGLPLYAIPTTAGTGSEATTVAVVSDREARTKYAIVDPKLVPEFVALDPKLTAGLPPAITAATGMDALTHAVESYLSTLAFPESDGYARSAAALILQNLPTAWQDGRDLRAREDMLVASCLAGLAFSRAGVGYVHAFAHQMGGRYRVPHGLANAIILPQVLDFSKSHCASRLAELASACGIGESGMDDMARAESLIARIRAMNAAMGIPATIEPLRREDFEAIIDLAFAEAHGTYGLPRYMTRDDARALLGKLLA